MSELLAAAAATLGAPEHLVERSAQARASATGSTVEAVLAAWAGGEAPPAALEPPTLEASAPAPTDPPPPVAPEVSQPEPVSAPVATPAVATAVLATPPSARRRATPVLEGRPFRAFRTWVALAGFFAVGLVVALVIPLETGGDFTHIVGDPVLSETAEQGAEVYLREGCWYCHTQLVRPVLADVGLGRVTETFADSLTTAQFGVTRIGPDLSQVGARPAYGSEEGQVSATELRQFLTHPSEVIDGSIHPSYAYLSSGDLEVLAAYLVELR